jgi:glycosyltransferase involved in cell wall biosynthesis
MEGFGLPAVEAAACGCPVIATKASPLQGLLGDASIHINPTEAEISRALEQVFSSAELRARMSERGLDAARRLNWDEAARQMMGVIGEVAQR